VVRFFLILIFAIKNHPKKLTSYPEECYCKKKVH